MAIRRQPKGSWGMVGRAALAALLNGFLVIAAASLAWSPPAAAADPEDESVYLVLMAGTAVPHIIKMRDMTRCEEAAEFSNNAHCVEALDETMALAEAESIMDFATAAGAEEEPEDDAQKAEDEEDVTPRANPYAK